MWSNQSDTPYAQLHRENAVGHNHIGIDYRARTNDHTGHGLHAVADSDVISDNYAGLVVTLLVHEEGQYNCASTYQRVGIHR